MTITEQNVPHVVSEWFKGEPFVIVEVFVRHEDREGGYWTKNYYGGKTMTPELVQRMRSDSVRKVSFRLSSDWMQTKRMADFTLEEIEAGWHPRSADEVRPVDVKRDDGAVFRGTIREVSPAWLYLSCYDPIICEFVRVRLVLKRIVSVTPCKLWGEA